MDFTVANPIFILYSVAIMKYWNTETQKRMNNLLAEENFLIRKNIMTNVVVVPPFFTTCGTQSSVNRRETRLGGSTSG